jgi:uncharacterized protein YjbI with pentapeptide repeats
MNKNVKKGSLIELFEASKNNIKINLLRKSFSNEIIKGLDLSDSLFARCDFSKASIYASTFKNTDFVKCDFSNSDLYHISFIDCRFNECKFDNSKCDHIMFIGDTILNQCSFIGINLNDQDAINGVDFSDLNIISENNKPIKQLIDIGYVYSQDDGSYNLKSSNDYIFLSVVYDPEIGIYRNMIFIDDQPMLTTDLDNLSEYSNIELFRILSNAIHFVIRKYYNDDQETNKVIVDSLLEIENNLKKNINK